MCVRVCVLLRKHSLCTVYVSYVQAGAPVGPDTLHRITGRPGVIVDVVPKNVQDVLRVAAEGTRVLDHHVSNKAIVEALGEKLGGDDVSGVGMAWLHMHGPEVPLPRHWDLVQKRDVGALLHGPDKAFVDALYALLPMHDLTACFRVLQSLEDPERIKFFEQLGESLDTIRAISCRALFPPSAPVLTDTTGLLVHVLNCTDWGLVNDLARLVLDSCLPEVQYVILWQCVLTGPSATPMYKLSVRARPGGFDTTQLTKALGGGGHAAASGATSSMHPVDIVRSFVYLP